MPSSKESLGIQRISSVHWFVRDLVRSRDHYVKKLDFAEVAVSTPEFEAEQQARASVVEAGGARFVFVEPLGSKGESFQWLESHPEGVGRVVFDVIDVEKSYAMVLDRGGTPMTGLERREVGEGIVRWFDLTTAIGDTLFRFIQHTGRTPILPGLRRLPTAVGGSNRFGISHIDHITSNFLTLTPVLAWMEQVMGLERFWGIEFHTQDVKANRASGSGLKSVVMWDPHSGLKFANNEPAPPHFKASQIYAFCRDHRGPGIQHMALSVSDLVGAVEGLRRRGVQFMPTPGSYYDLLSRRLVEAGVNRIEEDIETLRRLEILVDGRAARAYLLQIFLKEAASLFQDPEAGPFFLELLQRKGDDGFGGGNFRALFDSIERQQELDSIERQQELDSIERQQELDGQG